MSALDRRVFLVLVTALILGILPVAASAQCGFSLDKTPVAPADPQLWGALKPLETAIPRERDATSFDRNSGYSTQNPFYRSLDIAGGRLFGGFNLGVRTWTINADGTLANSALTTLGAVPIQRFNPHDYFRVKDVDATAEGDLLTMTGWGDMGLTLWEVGSSNRLSLLYQDAGDAGKYGEDLYVTRINGVRYAFLASQKSSTYRGLHVYNIDQAAALGQNGACVEQWPTDVNCSGAHIARMEDIDVAHVAGAGNNAQGHFLASSIGAFGRGGVTLWRVSNPASPQKLFDDFPSRKVQGLEMWEQGGKLYLAMVVRSPDEAHIYDMSCLRNGSCNSLGNPIYSFPITGFATSSWPSVTRSESNGTSYLYIGQKFVFSLDTLQAEWLLDVSNPAQPVDVLGGDLQNGGLGQPTMLAQGTEVGYWSWYYSCHPSGSNWIEPNRGIVYNGNLYRAASSILDIHEVGATKPRIQVTAAAGETYEGQALSVSASAFNCTPSPTGWSWSASGGGQVSGSGSNVSVTWTTAGSKTVSASNTACGGAEVQTAAVTVRAAKPAIGSVTANVAAALSCSPVTFSATGVTGRPPLTHTWEILDPQGSPLPSPTLSVQDGGNTAVWDTRADQPPAGSYRARLTVSNSTQVPATKTSGGVAITNPGQLGFSAPVGATINFGTVDFAANGTGATEWRWTFGDGDTLTTSDPVQGPNPRHVYDAIGTYTATVEIRNCVDQTWLASVPKPVVITEINPLAITRFQAKGSFGHFIYDVGSPIQFSYEVSGDPEFYDYDWDGNGSFEDAGNTQPKATHSYSQAGNYKPVLRVRRGSAEKTFTHLQTLQVSAGNASISVGGPVAGTVNSSYTFGAQASGCTPTTGGWNWSASGGGVVTGNGSSVQVRWTTPGTKTVTVSNSGCGSAEGRRNISISNPGDPGPGPGPSNLNAVFTVTPVTPKAGEPVTLNGTASTGSPTGYTWWINGTVRLSGATATHTFPSAGTYQVELEVGKPGNECSFRYCTDSETKTVQVLPSQTGPQLGDNGCTGALADDSETLCLGQGRYQLQVDWRNQHAGGEPGTGKAVRLPGSERTGFFYFFNTDNIELIVKILDGTAVNGHIWVFYGSLTDVAFDLTVTDTELETTKTYENLAGSQCGFGDNIAFPVSAAETAAAGSVPGATGLLAFPSEPGFVADAFRPGEDTSGDESDPETLVLWDGRFEVSVDFVNQHDDNSTGTGKAIAGTRKSGYFWFFREDNLELAVKIIDGRPVNGNWWVFWGGLSDIKYTISVRDTETGDVWTSPQNPAGSVCGGNDLAAH